ncbi:STN and carboxypeptidase regulatory-like domain-containing protein [uncultured Parabacteroides sp.]|uniref:STN and carboxypeptidase regulatory-like domain-containing protein n=1 Tax=uncultured Parabacteroides sp. TaxID=512312 RepID=UPI0025D903C4|nr:STN and carboxypeptidase regulatory-like domain-containing protein [uncultured Parabacteroides sp.]
MIRTTTIYRLLLLFWILLLPAGFLRSQESDNILGRIIHLSKEKNTVYRLLDKISDQTGMLFIYDSKLVDNEKTVRIPDGDYTVRQAIYLITENEQLDLSVIGDHILISQPQETIPVTIPDTISEKETNDHFVVKGILLDKQTHDPIEAGTIGVLNTSIGSITNANGEFRLTLPDSLRASTFYFSHLGYEPQEIAASLLTEQNCTITLEAKVIPIQEVIVRIVNPLRLLRDMQENIRKNYPQSPAYLTTFYREGIERKNQFVGLTEAVFKVYKSAYKHNPVPDQVKLLKMRRIISQREKDTIIARMKSGIGASLHLDLIKEMPDFLLANDNIEEYTYASTDITVIDNRLANVIYFEQRENIHAPLYRGELYIDSENNALLRARFEINPKYIKQTVGMLVEKKSRNLKITPQRVTYTVTYKPYNGQYYINHVRGDLYFKIKRRKQLFGTFPLHTWFEMVTCKVDTDQVSRFTRNEALPTRTVFAETEFTYDEKFWGNFNVIPPEEQLNEAIGKISSKIEETEE